MNNNKIDISVIVPVYNAEKFIEDCLYSIIKQDFKSIEILVSDDYSTDNTRDILLKFKRFNQIKIFFQTQNIGITANCNFLLQNASGKYISFFAGDDIMLPSKLKKQFEFMENNPLCSFCYHRAEILLTNENGNTKDIRFKEKPPLKSVEDIIDNMGVPESMSMLVRSSSINPSGFNDSYQYISDWLMQIELAMAGEIGFIDEYLCKYRKYGINNGKANSYEDEFLLLLEYVQSKYPLLSDICKKGKSRYLLGRSFRETSSSLRRKILKNACNENLSLLNFICLIVSYIPFSGFIFRVIYNNRLILKKHI